MNSYLPESSLLAETTGQLTSVRVGKIVSVDEGGKVWVDFPGITDGPAAARFTGSVKIQTLRQAASDGQEVLLVFENNDPRLPIIIDVMHSLLDEITEVPPPVLEAAKPDDVAVDGKRIVYEAKDEIVLRCGKASITLTRAGKVLIRGEYVLSRSSGVNRIKGGSVQIN
jgi:uncharacterized protein DUF6484